MPPTPELRTATGERAPTLDRRLRELRAALWRQAVAYGIGTILGAASLWLTFAFLADWGLRVPHGIRILHGLALVAVVGVFAWRDLLRPLRGLPREEGLALLYERATPELRELLISAVRSPTSTDCYRSAFATTTCSTAWTTRRMHTRTGAPIGRATFARRPRPSGRPSRPPRCGTTGTRPVARSRKPFA
jgi:MFS family permease